MTGPIPFVGGPWHGRLLLAGGGPNERVCLYRLMGGIYRVSADGKRVEWVKS